MKILLSEAENWVKPGRSKIYDDARKGTLSTEKDPTRGNKKVVDTAELQRVYGEIHNPADNPKESNMDTSGQQIDPSILLHAYENQIQDLRTQLELAAERETALISEKVKLWDLLSAEKEEKAEIRALMPPPETTERKGWLQRLIGVR